MDSNPQQGGNVTPPKPWERVGSSSGPAPFRPPSAGKTSDVVEASGTAKPGEMVSTGDRSTTINRTAPVRPVPARPWEQQQTYGTSYGGGYGTGMNYNSGYGGGMYGGVGGIGGGGVGGIGGSYGGGMYGSSMYNRGGYGGGLYGGGSSMYGGGMYNNGGLGGTLGGPMGGYGMGGMGMGGQFGDQDPNNPYGAPPSPPSFWISFLRVMQGVVTFFGRISILIDQNTQAFHLFMSALLQLFDRSGMLYGELARFVLRVLGIRTKPRQVQPPGPGSYNPNGNQNYIEGPKVAPSGAWDNVWGDN